MTEHINSAFDTGLKEVNKQIAKLGALAETQLDDSLTALKEKNIQKFESIINRDKSLDKITADVSSSVFELLALWSPIAYDLRSLLVADRVGAILERIGDYSKNIARRSQVIVSEENFDRLPVNIIGLGQHVQDLLHKSLDAYMELNIDKAMNIWESDIDTDRLYLSIFKEILSYMSEKPDDAKMLTHLIFISKNLIDRIYFNGRKNLIKRCINNLIDNAIKYGKKVNIELNKNNNNIFIKIDDDGPGIPEIEYENVFKPFYKINKGRADSKSSVGLGLSIASDIIRSHGGNINLEKSKMNGLGVKIFLPF